MVKIRIPLELYLNCILGVNRGRYGEKKHMLKAKKKMKDEYGVDFEIVEGKVLNYEFNIL